MAGITRPFPKCGAQPNSPVLLEASNHHIFMQKRIELCIGLRNVWCGACCRGCSLAEQTSALERAGTSLIVPDIPAGGNLLPRKPNYKLERFERDRAKAEKKAARLQAKADRRVPKTGEDGATEGATDETSAAPEDTEETNPGTI